MVSLTILVHKHNRAINVCAIVGSQADWLLLGVYHNQIISLPKQEQSPQRKNLEVFMSYGGIKVFLDEILYVAFQDCDTRMASMLGSLSILYRSLSKCMFCRLSPVSETKFIASYFRPQVCYCMLTWILVWQEKREYQY